MNKEKQEKKEVKKIIAILKGVVVSDSMDKTCVVEVKRVKMNKKYGKQYNVSKKYKVHDEKNECQNGDLVEFRGCRPISKDKKWLLVKKINKQDK